MPTDSEKLKYMLINFCTFKEQPGILYGASLVPSKNYNQLRYRGNNTAMKYISICTSLNKAYNGDKIYPLISNKLTDSVDEYKNQLNNYNAKNNNPKAFTGAARSKTIRRKRHSRGSSRGSSRRS